jgi:hypothetical protein
MEHAREVRPRRGHDLRIEAITGAGSIDLSPDEAYVPELLEVLGHCRLGEGKELDEATADAPLAGCEDLEDADADRMAQGLGDACCPDKGRVERFGLRLGHKRSSLYLSYIVNIRFNKSFVKFF